MRAIVTGFTADCAKGSSRVGFESLGLGLVRICKALGWEVTQKPMLVDTNDDDLAAADVLFMGIAPFNAVGSRYLFGAMDAIAKAKKNNCALIFYVTDYQTHLLVSGIKSIMKKPHTLGKFFMRARTDFIWGVHNLDYLTFILDTFYTQPWPETIVPTHTWFEPEITGAKLVNHIPARRLCFIDPTAFTTGTWELPEPDYDIKAREWTMAALGDYTYWLNKLEFEWPVRYFGGKTHVIDPDEPDKKVVNQRITEKEVNGNYWETWGALAPKHQLSGTAWWRTRYDFALRSGSILYGDIAEVMPIGDAFANPLEDIEAMNHSNLVNLQQAQREQYEKQIEPTESILMKIVTAVENAKAEL